MTRYIATLFTLMTYLLFLELEGINLFLLEPDQLLRDYYYFSSIEDKTYLYDFDFYCLEHSPVLPKGISSHLLSLIPADGSECDYCGKSSLYLGYLDPEFEKYLAHLKQQLQYSKKYRRCDCLWPEYSQKAAQISDAAFMLFWDLISTTKLSNLIDNENEQRELIENPFCFLSKHAITISFIVHQFRFSDYYHVCQDIENFAMAKYDESEAAEIKDRLLDILEALYPKFFSLYTACYKKHPTPEIEQEIRFMRLLVNDFSGLEEPVISLTAGFSLPLTQLPYDATEFITNSQTSDLEVELGSEEISENFEKCANALPLSTATSYSSNTATADFFLQSNIFLERGAFLNDLLLYKEAIHTLTQAIQHNSSNRNAYIERAMAYFETNQLSLALKDYETAKKLTIVPPFKPGSHLAMMATIYIPENKTEFSKGLVSGTVDGAKISAVEFVPSIFSCCRGILNGLWAFVCSPIEVSQEMVNAAYAIGEFISNLSTEECFQCVVPELKELSLSWDKLNDQSRGHKIGFIIGKYGVEIFAPVSTLKGINKLRALKRANTMSTLEHCISQTKQVRILQESVKRASLREVKIAELVKHGRILTKTSNVQYHVMQTKHAWEKLLKLSGNVEKDFQQVILLLEKESIFSKEFFLRSKEFSQGKIIRADYQKTINGHKVQAIFETYVETNQTFLQDAWVITK